MADTAIASIISSVRRKVEVYLNDEIYTLVIPRKYSDLVSGDKVEISIDGQEAEIIRQIERRNLLKRSFYNKTKEIVANLDELWIVVAPPPLFNHTVIDRLLCVSKLADIKSTLIFNKNDIGYSEAQKELEYYKGLGINVLMSTAKDQADVNQIRQHLDSNLEHIALCGVSGVGKSTILKALIPDIEIRISNVSHKTGQGRQTTTLVEGYPSDGIIFYDLPGIQNFGVSHLEKYEVKNGFWDFIQVSDQCEYKDCLHLEEPDCAVKQAVETEQILSTRYQSYIQIMQEVEAAKPY